MFLCKESERPIFFEAFTYCEDENQALYDVCHIKQLEGKQKLKEDVKKMVGEKGVKMVNKILRR